MNSMDEVCFKLKHPHRETSISFGATLALSTPTTAEVVDDSPGSHPGCRG